MRYRAVHRREVEDIVALDIALRRDDRDWIERLPPDLDARIAKKLYYGRFFCHVFHHDYVVKKGHDCLAVEHAMCDARGAEYPGRAQCRPSLSRQARARGLLPVARSYNSLNPGIGHTSKCPQWH